MGRNEEAQLGRGHSRGSRYGPDMVKSMAKKDVSLIAAGSDFGSIFIYLFSFEKGCQGRGPFLTSPIG
jgi:hypothetical protein